MRLLLDTHVFLALLEPETNRFPVLIAWLSEQRDSELNLSVTSLWEIAIKWRLGKLELAFELSALPNVVEQLGIKPLPITAIDVLSPLDPAPATHDPFDRLLLAKCSVHDLRLLTADRALVSHPLAAAWR
jgi:PIN domain nuclease of toxin-antitoxin system